METRSVLTELNNGIQNGSMAMPMKDLTSDNESSFEMNRRVFNRTYLATPNYSKLPMGKMIIQRHALGLTTNQVVIEGGSSVFQKKWIGGNRDASQVVTNRRVNNSGAVMAKNTGAPNSFKNVKDNNTARDALIRTRSGGSRIPLKVTQKYLSVIPPVIVSIPITYYRILSAGWTANNSNNLSNNTGGKTPGIYKYTSQNTTETQVQNTSNAKYGRSYNLVRIDSATGNVVPDSSGNNITIYDTFGSISYATALTNDLTNLSSDLIAIIFTYDEPRTNLVTNTTLKNVLRTYGASSTILNNVQYRSSYVLVGYNGIGEGNGLEIYKGVNPIGDPNAWIDLRISISNESFNKISANTGYGPV